MVDSREREELRDRLDRRVVHIDPGALVAPTSGWIKTIRRALGMPSAILAERMGVQQPRVLAIEKAEIGESIRLRTLRRAAEAMGCRLVYAIVPDTTFDEIVQRQARKSAEQSVSAVSHTMNLEKQPLQSDDLQRLVKKKAADLIKRDTRSIWKAK